MIIETSQTSEKINFSYTHNPQNKEAQLENNGLSISSYGTQNILLNNLLNAGIIDENYRLKKNIDLPPLPRLSNGQLKHIIIFFTSVLTVNIEKKSVSFSVQDLMNRLHDKHGKDFTSIDIVGGFLRLLIRTSKDFCFDALKLLGLENPESLLNESFFSYPGPLNDIDIRFRSPQKEWHELDIQAEEITNLLAENSKIEKTTIKNSAFKKFCPVSLPRNTKETHTVFKVASLGQMIIPNISTAPMTLECLFVKKLKRESLFLQDALKIDIKKLIENLETDLTFESDLQKGWQAFIDILTQVIHVNDPSSVDFGGFPMLVSYFSRGYILGDGKIEEKDVLGTLRETFFSLDSSHKKSLFEQTRAGIEKCLSNHHERDLTTTVTFLFNFFSCLDGEKFIDFSDLWKAECGSFECEDTLASKINEAFSKHNLSFEIVKAILCLAGFCALGSPSVILKKHREQLHFQIKLQEHNSSYLLIPFQTQEALQEFQRWKNNKPSKESQELLLSIFREISKNHCSFAPAVPEISDYPLPNPEEMLSPLGYMVNTLILATGKWRTRTEELFYLFPFAISHKFSKGKEIKVLQQLIQELEHTPYDFLIPKIQMIPIPSSFHAKKFIRSWISLLAESQDKKLCGIAKKLRFDFNSLYLQEDPQDLIQKLLPVGVFEAQKILQKLQAASTLDLKKEQEIILKILSCLQKERLNESFKEMCLIYDTFLRRNSRKEIDKDFEKASLLFIESLIEVKYEYNAEIFLEKLIKKGFVSYSNSKTGPLWLKLCQKSSPQDVYRVYKKGGELKVWSTSFKATRCYLKFAFLLVENLEKIQPTEAFEIFDQFAPLLKVSSNSNDRLQLLVKKHIHFLFSIAKNDQVFERISGPYKIYLNKSESFEHLSRLIEIYIRKKDLKKSIEIWLQIMDLECYEKTANLTEILLQHLLSKNKNEEIESLIIHKEFGHLIPLFQKDWIIYANSCLKNKKKPRAYEHLMCLVLHHERKKVFQKASKETSFFLNFLMRYLSYKNKCISKEFKEVISLIAEDLRPVIFNFLDEEWFYDVLDFFERHQIFINLTAHNFQTLISHAINKKKPAEAFSFCKKLIQMERAGSYDSFYFDVINKLGETSPQQTLLLIDALNHFHPSYKSNIKFNILTIQTINRLPKTEGLEIFKQHPYLISDFLLHPSHETNSTEDFMQALIITLSIGLHEPELKGPLSLKIIKKLIRHPCLNQTPENQKLYLTSYLISFAKLFYKQKRKEFLIMFLISHFAQIASHKQAKKTLAKEIIKHLVRIHEESFEEGVIKYCTLFKNDPEKYDYEFFLLEEILKIENKKYRLVIDNIFDEKLNLYLSENKKGNYITALIEKYIFSIDVNYTKLFETQSRKIQEWSSEAIKKGLYINDREKFLFVMMFTKSDEITFNKSDSIEIFEKIFHFLLNKRHSERGTVMASQILSQVQVYLFDSDNRIVGYYKALANKISSSNYTASSYEKFNLVTFSANSFIQFLGLFLTKSNSQNLNSFSSNQKQHSIMWNLFEGYFACAKESSYEIQQVICTKILQIMRSKIKSKIFPLKITKAFDVVYKIEELTVEEPKNALNRENIFQRETVYCELFLEKTFFRMEALTKIVLKKQEKILKNFWYCNEIKIIISHITEFFTGKNKYTTITDIEKFTEEAHKNNIILHMESEQAITFFDTFYSFFEQQISISEKNSLIRALCHLVACLSSPSVPSVEQEIDFFFIGKLLHEIENLLDCNWHEPPIEKSSLDSFVRILEATYTAVLKDQEFFNSTTTQKFEEKCTDLFQQFIISILKKNESSYLTFFMNYLENHENFYFTESPKQKIQMSEIFFEIISQLEVCEDRNITVDITILNCLIFLLHSRLKQAELFCMENIEIFCKHHTIVTQLWPENEKLFSQKTIHCFHNLNKVVKSFESSLIN